MKKPFGQLMPNHLARVAAGFAIVLCGLAIPGCDRTDIGSGDSHHAEPSGAVGGGSEYHPPNTPTGSGVTNGVAGNETRNRVTGPGNTESGRGTTTRPSEQSSQPDK